MFILHFFICSIGLIAIAKNATYLLGKALFVIQPIPFYEYILSTYYPNKRYELLFYAIGIISLFLYNLMVYFVLYKRKRALELNFIDYVGGHNIRSFSYFGMLLLLNRSLFFKFGDSIAEPLLKLLVWFLILAFPVYIEGFLLKLKKIDWKSQWNPIWNNRIYFVLLVAALVHFCTIFAPFIFGQLQVMNDYLDIPEETIVHGKTLQNNEYFNNHNLWGFNNKYQLEIDRGVTPLPREGTYAKIPKNAQLVSFLTDKKNSIKYYYNDSLQALCVTDTMAVSEWLELRQTMENESERQLIDNLFYINQQEGQKMSKNQLDEEEQEFIHSNLWGLEFQMSNIGIIHHHNFVLGPINEYALGKKTKDMFMQYGYLNVVVMKNLLEHLGGITYQNYFKVWYSLYYVYYALFIGLLFLVLRKIGYVLIGTLLTAGLLSNVSLMFIFQGPGLSPVRHFFDIFVVGCLFLYLHKGQRIYLMLSLVFALVGILNNSQMGLFCLVALVITLLLRYFNEATANKRIDIIVIVLSGILGVYLFAGFKIGQDPLSSYYLSGAACLPVRENVLESALAIFAIGYIMIVKIAKCQDNNKYIAIFALIYSQAMLVYSVWGATTTHFIVLASVHVFTGMVLVKLIVDNTSFARRHEQALVAILVVLSLVLFVPAVQKYEDSKLEYNMIFQNHVTYQWDFDRAKFISTMNPKYFANAVELIQKYSDENSIYIISRYDNLIPFIANKYSAMPYFDVSMFLVTPKEMQQCIDAINIAKPQYLFIDSDIERNFSADIIPAQARYVAIFHAYSLYRANRMSIFQELYMAVKEDYEPVEKGYLITVYKRKSVSD